ncbi:hypothetical protein CPHO_00210 [Corynebacterium phocae]|uniref:Uncharacterized protein n=1 Tax=Corynebacterium phocae TaxID=161895 RepID=A0A1L7D0M3_9CORY|nr:hypothetical protein [Corynebacterium phocae]APT91613.1 hypothetical protein CPHO_00210 [Corynebacterium phocae]KAA8720686.1 hypothetical protein F4V58_12075 [Corynebacterium phocae]
MKIEKKLEGVIATPDDDFSGELRKPDYCVFFWNRQTEKTFSVEEKCRIFDAEDVLEVIEWAKENSSGFEGFSVLFPSKFFTDAGEEIEKMYILYGGYPEGFEVSSEPDFEWTMKQVSST